MTLWVRNENTFQCMSENFSLYKFTCNISVNIIVLRNGINVDLRVNVSFDLFIHTALCNVLGANAKIPENRENFEHFFNRVQMGFSAKIGEIFQQWENR